MPLNLAILIGINEYPNAINNLRGCINDVDNWDNLLTHKYNYSCIRILNHMATKDYVEENLEEMVSEAEEYDNLVLQYSGHGTQIPCHNNDEADGKSEAICLYDDYLIDDEIEKILSKLKPNINLTIISDSCFSGNLTRDFQQIHEIDYSRAKNCQPHKLPVIHSVKKQKKMFKGFDDQEQMNHILLSGCRENETSADGCFNGIYEGAFSHYAMEVLKNNKNLTVGEFYEMLRVYLPNSLYYQHPQLECSSINKTKKIFV